MTTGGLAADLVITGGTVVTPGLTLPADVLVRDGRVTGLLQPGRPPDGRRIDATGCLVLPGGVDPHCHVMGDVASATRAAALVARRGVPAPSAAR